MHDVSRVVTFRQLIEDGVLDIGDGYRAQLNELGGTGPIFLRAGQVTDTHIDFNGVDRFRANLAKTVRSKMSKVGDTIITTKGNSTGRTSFVTARLPSFVYSPHLSYWRSNDSKRLCGGFLRYWSRGVEFQSQLSGMKASTDMAPYLSLTDQRRLTITLPPIAEQEAIASILGAVDDKIELNRRMNATLEAMTRALFQSWFVDFNPVRAKLDGRGPAGLDAETAALFPAAFEESELGKLPVGWQNTSVEDICEINSSTLGKSDRFETLEYVEISEVNRGDIKNVVTYARGTEPSRARRRLRHGDTVISTVRPDRGSHFLALNPPEHRVVSTGFAVLTPTRVPWSFVHAAMTQLEFSEHLGQMADGGAYPAVRPEVIGAWSVAIPSDSRILRAFHDLCAPLFEQAAFNRTQSRTLANLRDTLLPKLLSGELSVGGIELDVAAAG